MSNLSEYYHLVGERQLHVVQIKDLLAAEGIHDYDPLRPDRFERLMGLRTADGQPLPKSLMAEIGREIRRLELVLEQLAEVEAEGG